MIIKLGLLSIQIHSFIIKLYRISKWKYRLKKLQDVLFLMLKDRAFCVLKLYQIVMIQLKEWYHF